VVGFPFLPCLWQLLPQCFSPSSFILFKKKKKKKKRYLAYISVRFWLWIMLASGAGSLHWPHTKPAITLMAKTSVPATALCLYKPASFLRSYRHTYLKAGTIWRCPCACACDVDHLLCSTAVGVNYTHSIKHKRSGLQRLPPALQH